MRKTLCLAALLAASPAFARVIPFAPYGWRAGTPITQRPGARHVVGWVAQGSDYHLGVSDPAGDAAPWFLPDPPGMATKRWAAAYEEDDGTFRLLEFWTTSAGAHVYVYSADSGATWKPVPWTAIDLGPRALHTGNSAMPFVVALGVPGGAICYYSLRVDGTPVLFGYCDEWVEFIGSDPTGSRLLILGKWWAPAEGVAGSGPNPNNLFYSVGILDLAGRIDVVGPLGDPPYERKGWITPQGGVYLNFNYGDTRRAVRFYLAGAGGWLSSTAGTAIAAPTADLSGAWIASSEGSQLVLRRHTPAEGLVERWRVPSSGRLAALSSGREAERVLVVTSRNRTDTQLWGFALWEEGAPPPSLFDEVILNLIDPGLERADVDEIARRGAMLLYSGYNEELTCWFCPPPPDPIGAVRVALRQRLVIPAAARARGAHGADWRTDLIVRNPEAFPVPITVRLLPNPDTTGPVPDSTLTLQPNETRLVPDVLATLFHLESGSGALLLVPDGNGRLRATSRTYTFSEGGTYGMSVDGVDAQNAAWVNLPRTIAAGLLGTGFRSNFVAADVSGSGTALDVLAAPAAPLAASVAANAQIQLSDLAKLTGAAASDTRSLVLTPRSGTVAPGVIAIDDRTNDPSWFGADAIAGNWIFPALVHTDGIGGAKWRTDLYLYNPHADARFIGVSSASFMLGPGEARVVRDFYGSVLGRTGVGRGDVKSFGVQVTSRVYAENPDGSTYGMVVPPLDELQRAYEGETLEIVGPVGGAGFRTNLVILQLGFLDSPYIGSARVQILDGSGAEVDAFDVQLQEGGRLQIDDVFRNRGLGDGPDVAVIRVTPSDGSFAAYATTIDNGTNDPVYFAGALGSH